MAKVVDIFTKQEHCIFRETINDLLTGNYKTKGVIHEFYFTLQFYNGAWCVDNYYGDYDDPHHLYIGVTERNTEIIFISGSKANCALGRLDRSMGKPQFKSIICNGEGVIAKSLEILRDDDSWPDANWHVKQLQMDRLMEDLGDIPF